jgi:hypothetical protein
MPFRALYVDYNGSYVLCCNVRSDVPEHEGMILGNAESDTVFDIFTGEKTVGYRRRLGLYGEKAYPCSVCGFMTEDHDFPLA